MTKLAIAAALETASPRDAKAAAKALIRVIQTAPANPPFSMLPTFEHPSRGYYVCRIDAGNFDGDGSGLKKLLNTLVNGIKMRSGRKPTIYSGTATFDMGTGSVRLGMDGDGIKLEVYDRDFAPLTGKTGTIATRRLRNLLLDLEEETFGSRGNAAIDIQGDLRTIRWSDRRFDPASAKTFAISLGRQLQKSGQHGWTVFVGDGINGSQRFRFY